ncbi:MAG: hypothetical protein WAV15_03945 [Minisyncoccia bacterium]
MKASDLFLTRKETLAVIEPFQDHNHCWGMIMLQALEVEKERRARLLCEKSLTGKHKWRLPRFEDSIDAEGQRPLPWCENCFEENIDF